MTTNNKVNEEAVNSLKGSTKKWSPNDQGSGIKYVVNGQNNTAQFVDGTFTTINVEYVIIDLLDTRGQVISSEKKSFINGSLDEQNTFTLDFGMEEADSLRYTSNQGQEELYLLVFSM